MGFRGTFKGTLKENFDRMMNPRQFLNEMDESNINKVGFDTSDISYEFDRDTGSDYNKSTDLSKPHELWSLLGDIPTNEDDEIEEPFLDFPIGTDREEIWHWFEDKYDISIGDIMNGVKDWADYGYANEVAMPNLTENYNRIQILNKKLSNKNLNEAGFDSSEEGYGDDPIDSRPKKDDAVYLKTPYSNVASRIMYIDSTHVYWKTDSTDQIDTGSKGGVYHIGQLRDKQLYNDLLTWMDTGDKTALETKQYTDI